ncbi:MAG TPA: DUF192 domain-containing protein [Candidatus Angelobacter sp.]|nr:DUF192 domain-containing protein [Candidatus Angelobacter sp.]
MKPLRALKFWVAGMLAGGLFICAGCQKSTPPPPAATVTIDLNEPTEAQPKLPTVKLYLGAQQMDAEMCTTPRETQTGMMFRKSMGTNDGMIFSLGVPQQASFWMKNCFIPLSVAYIDPDGVIQEIHPLEPQNTNPVVSAAGNIEFALETPQGWFDRNRVTTGMVVLTERGSLQETFGGRQ